MRRTLYALLCAVLSVIVIACGGGGDAHDDASTEFTVQVFEGPAPANIKSMRERPQVCQWICGAFTPLNQMGVGLAMMGTPGSLFFNGESVVPNAFASTATAPSNNVGFATYPNDGTVYALMPAATNFPAGSVYISNDNATQVVVLNVYVGSQFYDSIAIHHSQLERRSDGRYYFPVYRGRYIDF